MFLIDVPGWRPLDTRRGSNMCRTRDRIVCQSKSDLPAADTWFSGICDSVPSENILSNDGYCRSGRRDPASRVVAGAKNRVAIWGVIKAFVRKVLLEPSPIWGGLV